MGNCWSGFLAELQNIRRPIEYIERTQQARSARYNVRDRGDGIEFDNLLSEDDFEPQTRPQQKVLTEEECTFINQRRYDDLAEKQKRINSEIDEKLKRHEDGLRLEEEELHAAKREAAKVARQEKAKQQKTMNVKNDNLKPTLMDDSAFASWLSDDDDDLEDDHDLDTQEFEEFLAKVRQTTFSGLESDGPADDESKVLQKGQSFEETLAKDVEATKVAEQSLDALERWSPTFEGD